MRTCDENRGLVLTSGQYTAHLQVCSDSLEWRLGLRSPQRFLWGNTSSALFLVFAASVFYCSDHERGSLSCCVYMLGCAGVMASIWLWRRQTVVVAESLRISRANNLLEMTTTFNSGAKNRAILLVSLLKNKNHISHSKPKKLSLG